MSTKSLRTEGIDCTTPDAVRAAYRLLDVWDRAGWECPVGLGVEQLLSRCRAAIADSQLDEAAGCAFRALELASTFGVVGPDRNALYYGEITAHLAMIQTRAALTR